MKKLLTNAQALTFAAVAGMSTVFGLTSCQQDEDFFEPTQQQVIDFENEVEEEDSLASTDSDFVYDGYGTSSPSQYIPGFDYVQTNSRSLQAEESSFMKDISLLITQNKGTIITTAARFALNMVLSSNEPDIAKELEDMKSQISRVQNMLIDIEDRMAKTEYSALYNERLKNLITLRSHNCTYLASYYEYIAAGDTASANATLDDWQRHTINKNNADYTVKEFLTLTPERNNSGQKSVLDIYDFWVFQTTPWEHMGYAKRDALRQGDIITGFAGYILTKAYYEKDKLINRKAQIEELNAEFDNFCKFYEGNEYVKRHKDRIVCQIANANIVFKKGLKERNMEGHPWFPNETSMYKKSLKQVMYGDKSGSTKISSATALTRSLKKEEAEAIYNYYNSPGSENIPGIEKIKKSDNGKRSLENILDGVGFDLSTLKDGKQHVMTLNDDCHKESESFFNSNYHFYYDNVALMTDAEKPFRSNWKVGTMWLEKKHKAKSAVSYFLLKWWDHYDSANTQFIYTTIEKRYEKMKPFED